MTKSPTINFFSPPSLSSQLSSCSRNLSNQRLFQRFWYSSSVTLSVIFLYFTWSLLLWFELWLISSNFSSTSFPWNLMLSCRSAMSFFKIYFLLSNCYIFFSLLTVLLKLFKRVISCTLKIAFIWLETVPVFGVIF